LKRLSSSVFCDVGCKCKELNIILQELITEKNKNKKRACLIALNFYVNFLTYGPSRLEERAKEILKRIPQATLSKPNLH